MNQDFTVQKKQYLSEKKNSPEKTIPAQAVSEKKNSCKLKIPHPLPPITFLMVRPLVRWVTPTYVAPDRVWLLRGSILSIIFAFRRIGFRLFFQL